MPQKLEKRTEMILLNKVWSVNCECHQKNRTLQKHKYFSVSKTKIQKSVRKIIRKLQVALEVRKKLTCEKRGEDPKTPPPLMF